MADKKELRRRQLIVGQVSNLRDAGLNASEIAAKLNIPETTVRGSLDIIKKADEVRAKKNSVG